MIYKKGSAGPAPVVDLKAHRIARLYAKTQEELDKLLAHCGRREKAHILRRITPHLTFTPKK